MSEAVALNRANLPRLRPSVQTPGYDPAGLGVGIVHLGLGNFHRAHMARYTDAAIALDFDAHRSWAIAGAGLLPGDRRMRDALAPQDGLYTLVEREGDAERVQVVGSIPEVLFAGDGPGPVLARIAMPDTRIVSLTVTENGYCLNPATKQLDLAHPAIAADLAEPARPRSAIGILVEAYRQRREGGRPAFTALSCDNIQHNGRVLRGAVLALAERRDPALAAWIEREARFPNSMVDRITPVTTERDTALLSARHGIEDRWPVFSETFTQWVIEDEFALGRPAWERVGAQFVPDVAPYEFMKLRLLNASHLAISGLGRLAGATLVDEAMRLPHMRAYMAALMERETGPTLPPVPGIDLPAYKARLLDRFANPAIRDTVERVNTDAPLNVLVDPIRDWVRAGQDISLLALALAAWIRRVRGEDEQGGSIDVRHPMAAILRERARQGGADPTPVLGIESLFGELGQAPSLVEPVRRWLGSLYERGSLATLALAAGTHGFG